MTAVPTLSVCIPNYNMTQWVDSAIRSGLAQLDAEVVVVDNASTDGSKELLKDLSNDRLRIFLETEHVPAIQNLRRTIERATGEWIVLLSADDELLPRFSKQLFHAIQPDLAIVSQAAIVTGREGPWIFGSEDREEISINECVPHNPFCLATTAFRRSHYEYVGGFNTSAGELADWDLWISILGNGGKSLALPSFGGIYEMHRGSTWSNMVNTEAEIEARLNMLSARFADWESWGILESARNAFANRSLQIGRSMRNRDAAAARRVFALGAVHGAGPDSEHCKEWRDAKNWYKLSGKLHLHTVSQCLIKLADPQFFRLRFKRMLA